MKNDRKNREGKPGRAARVEWRRRDAPANVQDIPAAGTIPCDG
jgi:hypothetical protein